MKTKFLWKLNPKKPLWWCSNLKYINEHNFDKDYISYSQKPQKSIVEQLKTVQVGRHLDISFFRILYQNKSILFHESQARAGKMCVLHKIFIVTVRNRV